MLLLHECCDIVNAWDGHANLLLLLLFVVVPVVLEDASILAPVWIVTIPLIIALFRPVQLDGI